MRNGTSLGWPRLLKRKTQLSRWGNRFCANSSSSAYDAEFLRKMTPTKVKERLSSSDGPRSAPSKRRAHRSENGLVVLGAAFALGVVVAKLIDWRSYAT